MITDFGDAEPRRPCHANFSWGYGRVCGNSLGLFGVFAGLFRSIFGFFNKFFFFTITDFGDDGSAADGGTKSVIIIIVHALVAASCSQRKAFASYK